MEGTRQSILNRIIAWAITPQETTNGPLGHTYWFFGSPGIGKTSLAHSVCEKLHDRKHLAGAFFCRRDDPNLNELANIIPTLMNALARIFPPFRSMVADCLRNDPNLTSKSMKDTLFLEFIRNLPRHPKHALVFVIDALDECGDDRSRPGLLKVLSRCSRTCSHGLR
jgi:Cdc6-like AAA superfamily ATPase